MDEPKFKTKQRFYSFCKKQGFIRKRRNLYRCYGQGLLQVIQYHDNKKDSTESVRDSDVLFGIFSLYSKLPWISSQVLSRVLSYDLPVILEPKLFLIPEGEPLIYCSQALLMQEVGIPYLNEVLSHTQLKDILEKHDLICTGKVTQNDTMKIAPYILSANWKKAIECITAIEEQNWNAYHENSQSVLGYDQEMQRKRIETQLFSIISLRDAIISGDHCAVKRYLYSNYRENTIRLQELGIPVSMSCVAPEFGRLDSYVD